MLNRRPPASGCSFCARRARREIAAPLDDVIDLIERGISEHYDNPDNAGVPWESAEGGYQFAAYTTDELLSDMIGLDLPRDNDGTLLKAIVEGIDNELWSEAHPFSLTPEQRLSISWEQYCEYVKFKRRYFF
ncbi:HEPN-associated N-terminal domain-containing protein [Mesorhizobium sp. L2C085B000]|uniref:HEPN-associated N-terminal domain-containing protein n=1 Tax=Mesorhizobium sp. L2C085B000 TaxID=1287117 RepID=UPI0012DE28D3|nr:HEPN-associated N-terminal domain-containing protein [Mesorhizobium sp. L2C085B000]